MIIFKRELRRNLKYFIIWTALMIIMFLYMAFLYPTMADQAESMQSLVKGFPDALLKAFNLDLMMDFSDITKYFAGEPYVLWLLFGSIFTMILASGILSKEESDGTIEFLLSKPVTRNKIITYKLLNTLFYVLAFNFILSLTAFAAVEAVKEGDYSRDKLLLLFAGALLVQLTFAAIGFLISVFIVKTKSVIPVSIGVVLGAYFLNTLAGMSDKTEQLKYLTPFKYVDARDILLKGRFYGVYLLIIFIVIIISVVLSYVFYNKKDIRV